MADNPGFPPPDGPKTPSRSARRGFVLGGLGVLALGAVGATRWFNLGADLSEKALSVQAAHEMALGGQITLIDIRRPDEWARTGVPEGAIALDMRRTDFTQALLAQVGGANEARIALICARGVRSRKMALRLRQAGFTDILDVPEGMLGSGAGPGWIKSGLPVVR